MGGLIAIKGATVSQRIIDSLTRSGVLNNSGINAEWQAHERLRVAEDHFLDRKENELAKLREALLTSA